MYFFCANQFSFGQFTKIGTFYDCYMLLIYVSEAVKVKGHFFTKVK